MDGKRHLLTPQKRSNESSDVGCLKKRTPGSGSSSGSWRFYELKILLPNGMTLLLKISEGTKHITVRDLACRVRDQYDRDVKKTSNPKKEVKWDAELSFIDDSDHVFKNILNLTSLELNRVYNLRLNDGSEPPKIYENMWDLTPDTELLKELPEEYTFETALADIIDNSLQAVWSNDENDKRFISVEVTDDKISIVDTGPGMDSLSIEKWGKMGASLHRASKTKAIGGKPPYLKPAFGMFGYGGFVASMHLGRYTEVSSKTKNSKKVYMLRIERDALVSGSGSNRTWRTSHGSLRDPTKDERELSPFGSFTKVDIFEPKMRSIDIRHLKCKFKDIYFPYIQCDDLSKKGRTTTPIEFQVNGDDLAEIPGGEVAITNLNSCNGPEFVLQLRFHLKNDDTIITSSPGARTSHEANARLRCVYLPVKEGNESIQSILETLKEDGYEYTEDFGSFSHVSCRRLGRLLPDARWTWLPFMDFRQRKADRSQVLKRSSMRVKCFIETDAGFSPTPYKTDFAHQNPYTTALRNLGSRQPLEKETGVHIEIRRDAKPLTLLQLDKQYQQWLIQMHAKYDDEVHIDCGIDEPLIIVNLIKKKELHIESNVVRVHKALRRKGNSWKAGQRIKILKGACAGFHKTNIYATLDCILLEGLQEDAGEAWIICRPIDVSEEDGCLLKIVEGNTIFDLRKSVSIPINVIDSGKCLHVDASKWDNQLEKQNQKSPSSIEILDSKHCRELGIEVTLPDELEVYAGHVSPREIVAVVRPATFKSESASKILDQKYVMKDNFEMSLAITFSGNVDESQIYSGIVSPSSQRDFHGLYVFQPKCEFHRAGIYTFTFSIRHSKCQKCVVKVHVKASLEAHKWVLAKKISSLILKVGCCCKPISIARYDKFDNQIPFLEVPKVNVQIKCTVGTRVKVCKYRNSISSDKLALILEDLVIKSSDLDNIRPNYDAVLMLRLSDGSHMLHLPIKVFPGLTKCVGVQPDNFEKQLIPGKLIKELTLELFDACGNHVQKNEEVQLSVEGFCSLDKSFSIKKVDNCGFIDLGGLLTVSAGYGRKVSLSVCSDGKVVLSKEWQIEERQLRTASVIPEICFAGSQLENLEFEIVDSKGDVDVNFHDEDNIGQSHTLVIKSQSVDIDESVKYVFRNGHCIVRAVPVPSEIGDFIFVASHSRHPELQLNIKVHVKPPPEMENILPIMESDAQIDYRSVECHMPEITKGVKTDLESIVDIERDVMNDILKYGSTIGQHEERIQHLQNELRAIQSNLSELKVNRDEALSTDSPGKAEITARVESMADSAAALVTTLVRELSDEDCHGFKGRIIGIVALLGTARSSELSRMFAEYLGDQMLAVVCKSYEDLRLLEMNEKDGKLSRAHALHMFASELGQSINGRYHVLCIEEIRPCETSKDLEGRLLLPNPTLPNGTSPAGFLGYAVNMIDIDVDDMDTGTGLRETLFYRLFGEVQVYETRLDMERAIPCIKDGAVSLDGGILRGNGAVSLGCWEPDIIFPVARARNEAVAEDVVNRYNKLLGELDKENKSREIALKEFYKIHDFYAKYFIPKQPISSSPLTPVALLEKPPDDTCN